MQQITQNIYPIKILKRAEPVTNNTQQKILLKRTKFNDIQRKQIHIQSQQAKLCQHNIIYHI